MRVAVIGAGGIGAVLAQAAAHAGHDVQVAVRTPITTLSVLDPAGAWEDVAAPVRTTPDQVPGPVDMVFLTVKANDTPGAALWLDALCTAGTRLAVVQNGLDHATRVTPFAPSGAEVIPTLAYLAAERLADGRVHHISGRRLVVPAAWSVEVKAAVPSISVEGTDDMLTASWRKLLSNVVANPLTALTMRRVDVIAEPEMADLARGILREAMAVGRASGADLADELVEQIVVTTGQYGTETGSSMLYDRMAGRHLEHRSITGEVVRRGKDLGIPTPLNTAVYALLEAIDRAVR